MSLSEQMALEEERDDLRDQLCQILLSVPSTTIAFDGNIPFYVRSAFDRQQLEIERLAAENESLKSWGKLVLSELTRIVNTPAGTFGDSS